MAEFFSSNFKFVYKEIMHIDTTSSHLAVEYSPYVTREGEGVKGGGGSGQDSSVERLIFRVCSSFTPSIHAKL